MLLAAFIVYVFALWGSQKREPNPPTGVKKKHKGWDTFLTSQKRDKKRRDGTDKRREIARTRRVGTSF